MHSPPLPVPSRTLTRRRFVGTLIGGTVLGGAVLLEGCASPTGTETAGGAAAPTGGAAPAASATGSGATSAAGAATGSVLDASRVHDISVTFDDAAYDAMIQAFQSSGDKEWIRASVTIDGTPYADVGLRLKGNSSLQGLRGTNGGGGGRGGPGGNASADKPEGLPWLIRLDKYVDDQAHDGLRELVIRSNRTSTSLNEAVALDLMKLAGLASQDAVATGFAVNGGAAALRLAVEHPSDEWVAKAFGSAGSLYKAESGGDYSYRGDDPASYDEVFDLEAGDDEELTHLTEFLRFINESDDAAFASELASHLDVDAFAAYLAMQELVDNFDDIDGPGNNSYLYFDPGSGRMTVVGWDLNLAFGGMGGGGAPGGMPGGGAPGGMPGGGAPGGMPGGPMPGGASPDGASRPGGNAGAGTNAGGGAVAQGRPGGGFGRANILVQRFAATPAFATATADAKARLQADLFDSGRAQEVLDTWTGVLQGSTLVAAATITAEAQQVAVNL